MKPKVIVLFDIDGTLTPSRDKATQEIQDMLSELRKKVTIGIVGGSDFPKQMDQLGPDILDRVDFSFPENGLVAYENGKLINKTCLFDAIPNSDYNEFISYVLHYIADLDIPVKTGNFVDLRTGLVNISPAGRACTSEQRKIFIEFDKKHNIRKKMVVDLKNKFPNLPLQYSIGGQISLDVFPVGWSKVYCLKYIEDRFDEIHFFGDMTSEGGNDYEIAHDKRVISHTVSGPQDTLNQVREIFKIN